MNMRETAETDVCAGSHPLDMLILRPNILPSEELSYTIDLMKVIYGDASPNGRHQLRFPNGTAHRCVSLACPQY